MNKILNLLLLSLSLSLSLLDATMLDYHFTKNSQKIDVNTKINILDVKELAFDRINGIEFAEISGLAYKNGKLFALSDRGYLYTFDISIKNNKLEKLMMIDALKLKTKKAKILKKKKRDSEGLAFRNNNLLISFERKQRINLYDTHGLKIKKVRLAKELENQDNYLKPNKGLESVTYNKKYGVITAPEKPLINQERNIHTIYAQDRKWKFQYDSSITSLEFINEDEVLVLLRKFNHFTRQRVTTLLRLHLQECQSEICTTEVLAIFDSKKGYNTDNFEGLTKLSKNKYLMISDDNGSFFQKTLLVLFEIID